MSENTRFSKKAAREAASAQGLLEHYFLSPGNSWPIGRCRDLVFRNCVFSGVYFGRLLGRPSIERCVFESCNLTSANFNGCDLSSVVFRSCEFPGDTLTSFQKCKLENIVFEKSKILGELTFQSCSAIRMSMTAKEARRVHFRECRITDFRVTANSFVECGFVGCRLTDMDFSGIPFCEVGFANVEIAGSFTLPKTGSGFAIMTAADTTKILCSARSKLVDEDYRLLDRDLTFFSSAGYPVFCSHDSFGELNNKNAIATVIQIAGEVLSPPTLPSC